MAHLNQQKFCKKVKEIFPNYFKNVSVCDIGSLDINGSNHYLFEDYEYIGPTVCRYSPLLYLECVPGDFYFKGTTQDPDAYNFVSKIKC